MEKITIFWFRRDLRLFDNHGLFKALQNRNVLPVFIFDSDILTKLQNKNDLRINFIQSELRSLKEKLETYGSTLYVTYNNPLSAFKMLVSKFNIQSVYFNHDYEPYAINRDNIIADYLKSQNINVQSYKDQLIFEKSEILKKDQKPYTIYTPYSRIWKEKISNTGIPKYESEKLVESLYKTKPAAPIHLNEIGFNELLFKFPDRTVNSSVIKNYDQNREIPSLNATSKLSIHLRFGTISIRQLVHKAQDLNEVFLNELIWREFYMMILYQSPYVVESSFKKEYDYLEWINNESDFQAWCNGQTGYPIVDAGMRELNTTGFMHNRLRMITASFLTKHLLIDWHWGEAYFAQKLLDYELASNNGGWQWAASTGCDAVPYFRIFNPELQTQKFDPDYNYIKKWVPEFETPKYPKPIIEHKFARERALNFYKKIKRI
ncbi:MAG TPA: deoxyribodipyrimidine photolyase [Bacteroidales bacterium]|nr:deoxyribodipyrimidine photolyase [Bacteroidales bacterium]